MMPAHDCVNPGRIITFYSYKGGVGRSFILANVAAVLARWGARVLCVDWDLEAPGLHHFFPETVGPESPLGLLHLLENAAKQSATRPRGPRKSLGKSSGKSPRQPALNWKQCVQSAKIGATGKTIDLIAAGREADDYVRRVHDLDWKALYEQQQLGDFLEQLRREWAVDYDFVLLDSRTGLTDIGGVCTIHLPDIVVAVFTANHQSMGGTAYMAQRINEQRSNFFYSSGRALIMPLLSRWEEKDAPSDAKEWLPKVLDTLRPSYNEWRHRDVSVERLAELLKVPYKAQWNFGERLAVLVESATDPGSVAYHLHLIAAVLVRDFQSTHSLASSPSCYVEDAAKKAPLRRRPSPPISTSSSSSWNSSAADPWHPSDDLQPPIADSSDVESPGSADSHRTSANAFSLERLLMTKLQFLQQRNAPTSEVLAILHEINQLRHASGREPLSDASSASTSTTIPTRTSSTDSVQRCKSAPRTSTPAIIIKTDLQSRSESKSSKSSASSSRLRRNSSSAGNPSSPRE